VQLGDTQIDDTFAEAFAMRFTRLLVTAADPYWLNHAVQEFSGYSASVIACDAECGLDRMALETETPDGRPGAFLLAFGFSKKALQKAVANRVGQCVMTCPTTAVFDGLPEAESRAPLGKQIRYFGDGFQKSKLVAGVRYWRIPVMDGEFVVQESVGVGKGVAGGNFILQASSKKDALDAARRAAEASRNCEDVIAPFPGGVARSGSKVGSRYKGLPASTSDPYCPTLRGRVESRLHPDANCAYEIVIDGVSFEAVAKAMVVGMQAAVGKGVLAITAGNYGGKLGKHHFHLRQLLAS
jgi:formylmethanofuran--tetrahydromethanopterin N-formyltransferase